MKADWREALSAAFDRPIPVEEPPAPDVYAFDPDAPAVILDLRDPEPRGPIERCYDAMCVDDIVLGSYWATRDTAWAFGQTFYPDMARFRPHNSKVRLRASRIRRLAEAQNWRCCYCGCETHDPITLLDDLDLDPEAPVATVEHLRRVADAGGNTDDNLVMACVHCNGTRNTMTPLRWYALRQTLLEVWPAGVPITSPAKNRLRGNPGWRMR